MKLHLLVESGTKDDILAGMTKIWGTIMKESATSGLVRDGNGNQIGKWSLVDWDNRRSILDFAEMYDIPVHYNNIQDSPDGLVIDGTPCEDWFKNIWEL